MLYGDTALTVLREKNLKYGYGRHKNFHLNMYTKNGMLDASNFYYDYKDIILDGPTDNENIGIKESYYFGGSKRKIVYLKETKPIIITTEEAIILEEAITKERCNNDRTEAITQERSPPKRQLTHIFADEEKTDGMYVGVAQKPAGFSIKSILNDESDDPSINNRKRKHDLEINEELRDEVYYKLLPSILKISETIQSSRDYREKSYVKLKKQNSEILLNDF
ncbi:hypothetical protein GLOIN_2v1874914 [Rhizophagus irregularis DAOM 181602=DAOM 197198]|uniref:Uncharacterized protein n=1 Tax=Rhizophagus irregularis (strain DAOM 181602 / DAOM 197198 / MUCL 43194) TaxID=747089 RepID=A0A2P4Q571_RHIID|nr:hypothetical protein GLOIN_2v1874914 [Rhizophagus irregularis DAOM 181602=DAOM 197198]POG72786.1 hypothetical protein GLOIN_2v1874914 [Rhizophagus irregularis DAOM 181602=DAOM 197198]|eukprot:XP_025179652.1 hypothetical protein GLOIN_2v1874914 [Rhizophagus irregularis DAOM 181602=DAOM 197198]